MGENQRRSTGDSGSTDHKAHIDDQHLHETDKRKLVASDKAAKQSMIPASGENAAMAELKARKGARKSKKQ